MTPNPIAEFEAAVSRVQTMADGSPRFTFDSSEAFNRLLSVLAECQAEGTYLHVIVFDSDEWRDYANHASSD